jgi:Fuc2NAc and GlcNAc transferase
MTAGTLVLAAAALLASALMTALIRRLAVAHGVLDIPNERSSHSSATPRGGGLAIVMAGTVAVVVLAAQGIVARSLCMAFAAVFSVLAVGFMDDRFALPARIRLTVHLLAAILRCWLGGLTSVRVDDHVAVLGWAGSVLAAPGVAWC